MVTFWSITSIAGSAPETFFQWSQKAMTSRACGLGQVSAGVDQVVRAGVLGENVSTERARWDRRHIVLFQGRVAAPVHDGMEVQIEDRLTGGG